MLGRVNEERQREELLIEQEIEHGEAVLEMTTMWGGTA